MEKTDYCPHCNIAVMKGDPERVSNVHGIFHGTCWKIVKRLREQLANLKLSTAVQ